MPGNDRLSFEPDSDELVRSQWKPPPPPGAHMSDDECRELFKPFNVVVLSGFVTETGKIMRRSATGLSAKSQRKLARAIKTSRQLGLMPYDRRPYAEDM